MSKKLIITHEDSPVLKKQWPVKFSVKYDEGKKEDYYDSYRKAKNAFNKLDMPAALWQVDGMPELLLLKEWEK